METGAMQQRGFIVVHKDKKIEETDITDPRSEPKPKPKPLQTPLRSHPKMRAWFLFSCSRSKTPESESDRALKATGTRNVIEEDRRNAKKMLRAGTDTKTSTMSRDGKSLGIFSAADRPEELRSVRNVTK
eukprot:TRINITY_DN59496_c0_g1_i1.p1 TRINITY_DN59496_c0_g1~~TRINITY_DN59496_c0_g1_i1.p1  ORF type:complete len:130 (-),score=8.01 TRINITY_DN59496_c0_g1_i1:136-525(-)